MNIPFSILLLTPKLDPCHWIHRPFNQIQGCSFHLEQITAAEVQAMPLLRLYDLYLLDARVGQYEYWVKRFAPSPVLLLTETVSAGQAALSTGIANYLAETELSVPLLEHCLRWCTLQSQRSGFQPAEAEDTAMQMKTAMQMEVEHLQQLNQSLMQELQVCRYIEAALQESEARLNIILNSTSDGILIVDRSGKVRFANPAAARLLGQPLEALTEYQFCHPTVMEHPVELDLSGDRQEPRFGEMTVAETEWEGTPVYAVTLRDVTQRRQAKLQLQQEVKNRQVVQQQLQVLNQELLRSNAELEQFASIVSHDLQQPLASIDANVRLLTMKHPELLTGEAQRFINRISETAHRMQRLIQDLLMYARLKGNDQATLQPTDCNRIVRYAIAHLEQVIQVNQATIVYDPLPVVVGNPSQLTQLFQNLICNAIQYRQQTSPKIRISALTQADEVLFRVEDNGIGIEADYFETIFQIFKRLHSADKYPGTGIGLATCKKIVEFHGGRIWVESQVGVGTTFWFTLPTAELATVERAEVPH